MQILGITGDNASNNDTMIKYLGDALDEFPGAANQTRCFVHTVNLITKSILKPFDTRKAKDLSEFSNVAQALAESGDGHDLEEDMVHTSDNIEEEADEEEAEEEEEFDASLGPIRLMLLKVCLRFTDLDHADQLTNVE